jgi:hypothetical protein
MTSEQLSDFAHTLIKHAPLDVVASTVPKILSIMTAEEFLLAPPDHFDYIIDALIKPAPDPTLRDVAAFWATVLTARKDLVLRLHPQITALADQLSDQPTK